MNFKKHITPEGFKEESSYREEKAIGAFIAVAREIKANYSISGRFKVYRQEMEAVTVIINNKNFTYRGTNALYDCCTAAIYHVLDNYTQFTDLRIEKDRMLAEKNKLCRPKKLGVLIPARTYGY
jgi:hypothetical protein